MKRAPAPLFAQPAPATRLRATSRDGTGLHVEVHGPDRMDVPTVVLIHGWTCSAGYWAPVIRQLRGALRVVTYDQRGHGASDPPGPSGCSTAVLADDLTAVLDTAVGGGSAVLAGHSMGGMTILASADRPEVRNRTTAVLLASTGFTRLTAESLVFPIRRSPRLARAARRFILSSSAPMGPVSPLTRAALSYMTLGPATAKELAAINAAMVHRCDRRVRGAWGRVLTGLDISHALPHLGVPTRVLVGSRDRMTPPVHPRLLAGPLPRCEGLTVLPGVGHMTPLEAPGAVAALIRKLAATAPAPAAGAGA